MKINHFACLLIAALLSGCAFNVAPYGASIANVESLRSQGLKPVAVAKFQSAKPGLTTLTCRGAGPVTVTPSYEAFIEAALITELKLAGAYDQNSPIVLTGRLDEVDFSSGMTDARWMFTVTVANSKNNSFIAKSTYPFSASFVGDRACQEVAQAFGPAVQKLIGDVVTNPRFKEVAN